MNEYISREAVFQVVHRIAREIATKDTEALKAKDMKTFYKIKGAKEILDSVDTDLCYIPVADVQPVDRWISVNDKLPEQDEEVLVLTKDKDIMTMIYKVIPFRWYKPKFGGFDKDYVTHWKPSKDSDTE